MPLWMAAFPSVAIFVLVLAEHGYCVGSVTQSEVRGCAIAATGTWAAYYAIVTAYALTQGHLLAALIGAVVAGLAGWRMRVHLGRRVCVPAPRHREVGAVGAVSQ